MPIRRPAGVIAFDEGSLLGPIAELDVVGANAALARSGARGTLTLAGSGGLPEGWFSVKDYGAVGDGTTNDTSAVQAAHNAALAYGTAGTRYSRMGVVYFPPGVYACDTITWNPTPIPLPAVCWRGCGPQNSVLKRRTNVSVSDPTSPLVFIRIATGVAFDVSTGYHPPEVYFTSLIRDIGFSAGAANNGRGLHIKGAAWFSLDNLVLENFAEGIYSEGGITYTVNDSLIIGGHTGVYLRGWGGWAANAIGFVRSEIAACDVAGIDLLDGEGLTLTHCLIEGCGIGLALRGSVDYTPQMGPNAAVNTWFEGNTTAVQVFAGSAGNAPTVLRDCGFNYTPVTFASTTRGVIDSCTRFTVNAASGTGKVVVDKPYGHTVGTDPSSRIVVVNAL